MEESRGGGGDGGERGGGGERSPETSVVIVLSNSNRLSLECSYRENEKWHSVHRLTAFKISGVC